MKIQLKRSNVLQSGAAKEPTASQLEYGELAINYNNSDPAIFLKDSNNNIIRISGVGNIADDGLTNVPDGTTPPTNPAPEAGNLWYNSDEGRLYIYYVDANTSQWVDASPDSWDPTVMPVTTNPAAQSGTLDDRYVMENGDTMTGALLLDNAASASAPDLSFDGDANTGIYSPGADQVAISTSGTGRLFVDSTGQVGVGTSSPDTALDIEGVPAATTGGILRIRDTQTSGSAGKGGIHLSSSPGIDYFIAKDYDPANSPTVGLAFGNASSGAEFLRIDSSGNVGVGTRSPSALFNLAGNNDGISTVSSANNRLRFTDTDTAVGSNFQITGAIEFETSDSSSAGVQAYIAAESSTTGFGNLLFGTGQGGSASTKMFIQSDGRVGIGTTSPASLLNVKGSAGNGISLTHSNNTVIGELIEFSGTQGAGLILKNSSGTIQTLFNAGGDSYLVGGNVGIGTTSPTSYGNSQATLVIEDDTNPAICWSDTGQTRDWWAVANGSNLSFNYADGGGSGSASNVTTVLSMASSGNVGVGTTSPLRSFHVAGAGDTGLMLQTTNAVNDKEIWEIQVAGDASNHANLIFRSRTNAGTGGTEALRITNDGKVGVGTASPSDLLHLAVNASGDQSVLRLSNANATANNTVGINFAPANNIVSAAIKAIAEDSHIATAERDGALGFFTRPNGGAVTERVRIQSTGRLLVNRTSSTTNGAIAQFASSAGPHLSVNNITTSAAYMLFQNSTSGDTATDGLYVGFDANKGYLWNWESSGLVFGNAGALVGQFIGSKLSVPGVYSGTTTGGSPVYVESDGDLLRYTSSLKYKTDVETLEDARADAVLNCRPVWYRSKCENDIKTEGAEKSDWGWYGFIAEEVAEIEPRLVNWATKDAVTQEDGSVQSVERNPADYEAEGVRYDNFVPLLLNLVKRQKEQIEAMEARLSALEAS